MPEDLDDDYLAYTFGERPFSLEGERPLDKLPPLGQQLAAAWQAEHGDEPYPT